MQPGELIWFLVGIGAGLTIAISGFIVMAVLDGRRLRRLAEAEALEAEAAESDAEPELVAPRQRGRRKAPQLQDVVPMPVVPPEAPAPRRRQQHIAELRNADPEDGVVDEAMSTLAAEIARMQSGEGATVTMELPAPAEPMQGMVEASVQASMPEVPLTPMRAAMAEALARPQGPPAPRKAPPIVPRPVLSPTIKAPVKPALPHAADEAPRQIEPQPEPKPEPTPTVDVAPPVEEPPKPVAPPVPRVAPARKFAPALPPRKPN